MYPPSIQNLIEKFARFPTIGQRVASRFAFYLLKASDQEVEELISAMRGAREKIQLCSLCFRLAEQLQDGNCDICVNPQRVQTTLCIVEKESDLAAIEKAKLYKGLYFILGGTVGTLKKEEINGVRLQELQSRITSSPTPLQEIIIATNPTLEGESTALYIERIAEPTQIKTTRLARGLPVGGELEYADDETLKSALEGRK